MRTPKENTLQRIAVDEEQEKGEKTKRKEEKMKCTKKPFPFKCMQRHTHAYLHSHTERYDQSGPKQPEETDINQKTMCARQTTGSQ